MYCFKIPYLIALVSVFFSCASEGKKSCDYTQKDIDYGDAAFFGYEAYHKIEDAQLCSKLSEKPILIFFLSPTTAANSRAEWKVLDNKNIRDIVSENFVFVTLYTDDAELGEDNLLLENEKFGYFTQPLYVISNDELEPLADPLGSTQNPQAFEVFLKQVVE